MVGTWGNSPLARGTRLALLCVASRTVSASYLLRGPERPSAGATLLSLDSSGADNSVAAAAAADGAATAEAVVAEAERLASGQEPPPPPAAQEVPRRPALEVKILGARGLRFSGGKEMGVTDPYCVCEIPGKPHAKVQTLALDGLHGVHWNHEGEIAEYAPGDKLRCSVFERDRQDELLGRVVLAANRLLHGFHGDLPLTKAGQGSSAYLRLAVARVGAQTGGQGVKASSKAEDEDEGESDADDSADDEEEDEDEDGKEDSP